MDLRLGSLTKVLVLVHPQCISIGVVEFQFQRCGNENEPTRICEGELCKGKFDL